MSASISTLSTARLGVWFVKILNDFSIDRRQLLSLSTRLNTYVCRCTQPINLLERGGFITRFTGTVLIIETCNCANSHGASVDNNLLVFHAIEVQQLVYLILFWVFPFRTVLALSGLFLFVDCKRTTASFSARFC